MSGPTFTVTVSDMLLVSQLADLQEWGLMPDCHVDFSQVQASLLEVGFQQVADHSAKVHTFQAGPWMSTGMKTAYVREEIVATLTKNLAFRPAYVPDFPPRQVILEKGRRPVPLIIEKTSFAGARDVLEDDGLDELKRYEPLEQHPDMDTSAFLLRSWDGAVHAMCLGAITCYGDGMTFMCFRDVKFDRKRRTAVRDVGPVMTLARLLYMKQKGHWSDAAPVLTDIKPPVLAAYRERLPRIPPTIERDAWSVSRLEAEHFLARTSYSLVPLPEGSYEGPS